jgi:hypothetical protein
MKFNSVNLKAAKVKKGKRKEQTVLNSTREKNQQI